MKKYIIIIFVLFNSINSVAQLSNLCGVWLSTYQCYSNSGGFLNFYFKSEVIFIKHNGDYTIATKIIGDDCVTDGQITWQGTYNQNPFTATLTLGSPDNPGSTSAPTNVTVISPDTIRLQWGQVFTKATCDQIGELNLDLSSDLIDINCINCDISPNIKMPNVFTPNNDGKNDFFIPFYNRYMSDSRIKIFNRWGNLIYESYDLYKGWDGKFYDDDCPEGVYFWVIQYLDTNDSKKSFKGTFSLLR